MFHLPVWALVFSSARSGAILYNTGVGHALIQRAAFFICLGRLDWLALFLKERRIAYGTACALVAEEYISPTMRAGRITLGFGLALMALAVRAATLPAPASEGGYLKLGFDLLAGYPFVAPNPDGEANTPPPTGEEQIPAEVKGWSGKKAVVTGFMLPTKMANGRATEFLLMANQMACCFGAVPNMNDWVVVRMPQGVAVVQDVPISFYGTFRVGAMVENGYLTGIYALDAERMGEVKP